MSITNDLEFGKAYVQEHGFSAWSYQADACCFIGLMFKVVPDAAARNRALDALDAVVPPMGRGAEGQAAHQRSGSASVVGTMHGRRAEQYALRMAYTTADAIALFDKAISMQQERRELVTA